MVFDVLAVDQDEPGDDLSHGPRLEVLDEVLDEVLFWQDVLEELMVNYY